LTQLHKFAWILFASNVKRGAKRCFTCEKEFSEFQAGHILTKEYSGARYSRFWTRPQCSRCNFAFEGNHTLGTLKLIQEFGLERVQREFKNSIQKFNFNYDSLREIIFREGQEFKKFGDLNLVLKEQPKRVQEFILDDGSKLPKK